MGRGPAALFGAIVAVGLGPAMWLGVQLGSIEVNPARQPALVGEPTTVPDSLVGGAGAGADATDDPPVIGADPQDEATKRIRRPSPTPTITTSPSGEPTTTSPSPSPSSSSPSSPSSEPTTTPPTESTTAPSSPPTAEPSPPLPSSSGT